MDFFSVIEEQHGTLLKFALLLKNVDGKEFSDGEELKSQRTNYYSDNAEIIALNKLEIFCRVMSEDIDIALENLVDRTLYQNLYEDVENVVSDIRLLRSDWVGRIHFESFQQNVSNRLLEHLDYVKRVFIL